MGKKKPFLGYDPKEEEKKQQESFFGYDPKYPKK